MFSIFAYVEISGEIFAHQGEIVLIIHAPDFTDTLQRSLVTDMTTERVTRICRVDNDTATMDDIHRLFDQALLRVKRMYFEVLAHVPIRSKSQGAAL